VSRALKWQYRASGYVFVDGGFRSGGREVELDGVLAESEPIAGIKEHYAHHLDM
jgi:hypothetical protein